MAAPQVTPTSGIATLDDLNGDLTEIYEKADEAANAAAADAAAAAASASSAGANAVVAHNRAAAAALSAQAAAQSVVDQLVVAASAAAASGFADDAEASAALSELAAIAAGAPIVTTLTSPTPANGTIELLLSGDVLSVNEVVGGSWVDRGDVSTPTGLFVTLEQFDAVGDGLNDDQDAWASAKSSGKPVFIRADKTYLVTDGRNTFGRVVEGPGQVVTEVTGGHLQHNIPWELSPVQFRHFAHAAKNKIIALNGLKIVIAGDSTATNSFGANKVNLVAEVLEGLGVGVSEVLTEAVGGDRWGSRNYATILDGYAEQKDVLMIKLGTNDAGGSLGETIPDQLANMVTTMRTSLSQIRASTYGGAADLSIILIMPGALGNITDNENNRNNLWLEKIRNIYYQAARDYECVLYDPYAESRWAEGQGEKSLDAILVHPEANYDHDIWGRALESVLRPYGETQRNRLIFRESGEGTGKLPTDTVFTYPTGVSYLRASSGDGWDFSGHLETIRSSENVASQTLIDFTNTYPRRVTRHWRNAASAWSKWSGSAGVEVLSLQNSWVVFGGLLGDPSARRTADGLVCLSGVMKSGTLTTGTLLATLPFGYRPISEINVNAVQNQPGTDDTTALRIQTNGQITIVRNANAAYLGLDGISFWAPI